MLNKQRKIEEHKRALQRKEVDAKKDAQHSFLRTEQSLSTNSNWEEDFLGFEAVDIENRAANLIAEEANVAFQQADNSEINSDPVDEELILVENDVEVIVIDDDDNERRQLTEESNKNYQQISTIDLQKMIFSSHPLVELRKPDLNWKSDQFLLIYINGERQNSCICTKCLRLFDEINVDTIVKHARCNSTESILPNSKKNNVVVESKEDNATSTQHFNNTKTTLLSPRFSVVQALAGCIDVRASTFFQNKNFLNFAEFLINTGATYTNRNSYCFQPNQDVLHTFRDQFKILHLAKIRSILNKPEQDFSLSCDVWEDILRSKTNMSLALHYVDSNFRFQRIIIGVRTINGLTVNHALISEQVMEILKGYSNQSDGTEFLRKATAFITSGKHHISWKESTPCFRSACSIIHEIANEMLSEKKLCIMETCVRIIKLLNLEGKENISTFDMRKWESVYELITLFNEKASFIMDESMPETFSACRDILELLEPFHIAIKELSGPKNKVSKVYGVFKMLENQLKPNTYDEEAVKDVKIKSLRLTAAFASFEFYQICMFLDPSNRDQYHSLKADKMSALQSKIEVSINPKTTHENGFAECNLMEYMDENVTAHQNQIGIFLKLLVSRDCDVLEYWRDSIKMPGLKKLARKYFSIPTYTSIAECVFLREAKQYLLKRNNLEIKDLETMLIMNSNH